ncbi:dienelactone hydrolase family protein [Blastococcus capsensis]|uniref:dienelactone hydrolase family protein n=1 Tax=Blastococcus capsensis TaxID=1564163 RepID=UPI002541B615|nr:dienelactone hydrolase family protein [Blastococcus capsensis]MDK3255598.1 dienelactone hydrolase family protein [Blastococcus capsensis]
MAELVLFHHAQGLTAGCRAFADDLRAGGHVVHTPDLYEGRTFATLDDGVAHAEAIGFGTVLQRGRAAVDNLPERLVYAGFSLGVLPAQLLAQTRPGAAGAVLMHAAVPLGELGDDWPAGVPVQFHTMDADEQGDADVARTLAGTIDGAEFFSYPGDRHLFTDRSLPDHVPAAAALLMQRVLGFLAAVG